MLTRQQLDDFDRCGILRVPNAIATADAEAMCACVWGNLSRRYPVRRDDPETWTPRNALIRADPWVKALCSRAEDADRIERFMNRGANVDGIELRVVEMIGEPGDVYLVHPLMLHAPAINCAATPRIVLSSFVYRNGIRPEALYNEQ
ncbi:MAG: hypothetical protein Q7S58_13080 [Candidatus Binatus sp.]|uniref:hypothetical protein n=1 Tax=Candidatus Binatus sp. TaxID=2811406 RepID=UPI002715842C|nr:hypothetical protein [Candidatus Binatus sp.]MDO8433332.1 hypothetical protein [Candidatus Binatus sp.]